MNTPTRIHRSILAFVILTVFTWLFGSAIASEQQVTKNHMARLIWKATSTPCPLTQPIITGNSLFMGSCDGKFYGLDKQSGKITWSHDVRTDGASGGFRTSPMLHQGLVIAGSAGLCTEKASGYVYGFDRQTGKVQWKLQADVDSDVFADIKLDANSPMVVGTSEGELLSINPNNGSVNWRYLATPRGTNCESRTSVVTDGESVCYLAHDGMIRCLDAKSGRELWKQKSNSGITTNLLMYKDVLYFGSADNHIYGLEPDNGKKLVQLRTPYTPSGRIGESDRDTKGEFEFVYATDRTSGMGAVLSLSDEFQSVLWSRTSAQHYSSREPEASKGVLFTGNCQGDVVAYRIRDGEPQWQVHVDGCIESLVHDGSTLYIALHEGEIYAY